MKNIKTKVAEIQNYFINKITACDFKLISIEEKSYAIVFVVEIEGYKFRFGISERFKKSIFVFYEGDISLKVPNDRLNNLLKFIENHKEEIKKEEIERLKQKLKELES